MKPTVHIRMGAAHYDVTIKPAQGEALYFDLRAMNRDERRDFHRTFRVACAAMYQPKPSPKPKRRRRNRSRAGRTLKCA